MEKGPGHWIKKSETTRRRDVLNRKLLPSVGHTAGSTFLFGLRAMCIVTAAPLCTVHTRSWLLPLWLHCRLLLAFASSSPYPSNAHPRTQPNDRQVSLCVPLAALQRPPGRSILRRTSLFVASTECVLFFSHRLAPRPPVVRFAVALPWLGVLALGQAFPWPLAPWPPTVLFSAPLTNRRT